MLDYDFRRFDLTITHIIFLIIFVENHIKVTVCFIYIYIYIYYVYKPKDILGIINKSYKIFKNLSLRKKIKKETAFLCFQN